MAENGRTAYLTFAGKAKFATRRMRVGRPEANGAPPVASTRAYLRSALPGVYLDGEFGTRFVGSLEAVLDPIVAILDSLPAYMDADLAPEDMVELIAAWLGLDLDESWPDERKRELVRRAGELARRRGTKRGLEIALGIAFPDLPLRVEDGGGVLRKSERTTDVQKEKSDFVVYCDVPITEKNMAAIARMIEQVKPVHVTYRLRVKAPRKSAG